MPSQKISQLTAITVVASGDYFPVVQASDTTNKRVGVGVLDARYASAASGVAAQSTANTALASGNAALFVGNIAGTLANQAMTSGLAGISGANMKLPLSGGVVSGQLSQNIVSLGLNGSGINTALGNFFTATISGNSTISFTNSPSNVAYSFAYEVNHQTGTITWPGSVSWPSATAPTLTTGRTHIFMFVTDDSGATWRASSLINYTT